LLIGVIAKDDSQVVLVSLISMFIFSAMGGTWFPLEGTSGAFTIIGKLMPSAWAMLGYQNILIRGLGLESAWLPSLVLLAYAILFFGAAVWRFRKLDL
jgi:ABC-2 type transport system permease protein